MPFFFIMYHYKEEKAMKIKPFAVEEWMNAWEVGASITSLKHVWTPSV